MALCFLGRLRSSSLNWLPVVLACFFGRDVHSQSVNFSSSDLVSAAPQSPTCLDFGPDNRLYVTQQNGFIFAYTVVRNGPTSYSVVNTETIALIRSIPNHDDNGAVNTFVPNRQITGLLAVGTPTNPVLYVASSDPRIGGGGTGGDQNLDTNSGVISRLTWTGSAWTKVDLVIGLPRSEENHAPNGMAIDPATNIMYLAQGGNTNGGGPSNNFAFLTEYALSAAVLSIDLNRIETEFGGSYILPTLDDPTRPNVGGNDQNDPYGGNDGLNQAKLVADGPVQIHSPGYRNIYDIVLTKAEGRSGRLYTIDNGPNGGWGGHPDQEGIFGDPLQTNVTNNYVIGEPGSNGPGPNDAKVNNLDHLHYVSGPGHAPIYGGHPNPVRANPANAGLYWYDNNTNTPHYAISPTTDWPPVPESMANPVEGDYRNGGVDDGALYTWGASTNGMVEYTSQSFFNGIMNGNLLTAAFDGRIYRIELSPDGHTATNVTALFDGFGNTPLDVAAQGDDEIFPGTVWVANYGSNTITVFEPVGVASETWEDVSYSGTTMPQARHENGFVELGGRFYLIGGRQIKNVNIFDPVAKTWTMGAAPPIELHHFQAVAYQNKIYVVSAFTGGYPNETPVNNIYIYDPQANSWSMGATIPVNRRRGSAGVVLHNNKFYIAGGIQNGHVNGWVNWFDEYDPSTGQWSILPNLPQARDHFHAAIMDNKLYLAGGRRTGESSVLGTTISGVDVYNFQTGSWSTPTQLPTPRGAPAVASFNNLLLVAGGEVESSVPALSTVELYDPATNNWETKPPLNVGRHATQMVVYGGKLYLAAGSTTQGAAGETNTMSMTAFSSACSGADNPALDEDGDGYRNDDEIDNGTNPCSAASKPADNDMDLISNLNDPDDDNDGFADTNDKFALDPDNGMTTHLPIDYPFLNGNPGTGLFGIGATGLMTNNSANYASLYDLDHPDLIVGGAVGVLSVPADAGSALTNNQRYAFHFGLDVTQATPAFTVHSRLLGAPFFGGATGSALVTQSHGIFIGTGDQDNYLRVSLYANNGNPGFQVLREENGSVVFQQFFPVANILATGEIDLFFDINPASGSISIRYSTNLDPQQTPLGSPLAASGNLLQVIQGAPAMAVGVIASAGSSAPFSASWDFLEILHPSNPTQSVINVNGGGDNETFGPEAWVEDMYFTGGDIYENIIPILGTTKDVIYQSERYGDAFSYDIPVPQVGAYDIDLHFAEVYHGVSNTKGVGARMFNINIENQFTRQNYDIFAEAGGPMKALVLRVPGIQVADGLLTITITSVVDKAKLSGISIYHSTSSPSNQGPYVINPYPAQEVPDTQSSLIVPLDQIFGDNNGFAGLTITVPTVSVPALVESTQVNGNQLTVNLTGEPGTTVLTLRATDAELQFVETTVTIEVVAPAQNTPVVRINAGGSAVQLGQESWLADQYFTGGNVYGNAIPIANTTNDVIFQSERFGNFSYSIPVPQSGAYSVDLLFAELYHGVNNTKGVGARVFNLNVENQFNAQNVDVIQQAGAPATALILQASNIQVTDGFLNITFTTIVDNAKLSGIAVFQSTSSNPPPHVLALYPDQQVPDTQSSLTIPLDQIFGDNDGFAGLTITVPDVSNPALVESTQVNGTQLTVNLTGEEGSTVLTLRATDADDQFVETTASIQVVSPTQNAPVVRINAGGSAVQLGQENWVADQYFTGGNGYGNTIPIANTTNDVIFQSERYGSFSYSIPVPQSGAYSVDLLFAELYHGVNNTKGVGARVFNLNVENQFTAQNVDIIQQAGAPATALIITASNVQVTDGFLNITFTTVVDNAKLSGIAVFQSSTSSNPPPYVIALYPDQEVPDTQSSLIVPLDQIFGDNDGFAGLTITVPAVSVPALVGSTQVNGTQLTVNLTGQPGATVLTLRATDADDQFVETSVTIDVVEPPSPNAAIVRINAGGSAVQLGQENWFADQYFTGGNVYGNTIPIANTTSDVIFQSERYGSFSYSIPVPQSGAYSVDLLFAELYHGVNNTKGVGARVFNLNVENQFTAQNVDIIQQAGAPATALILKASNVQVSDGFLNITFTTVVDNAKLSGIAVFQSSTSSNPPPYVIALYPDQEVPDTQSSLIVPLDQIFGDNDGFAGLTITVPSVSVPALVQSTQVNGNQLTVNLTGQTGTTVLTLRATDADEQFVETTVTIDVMEPPSPNAAVVRINTGGSAVQLGEESWVADQYFTGGNGYGNAVPIANTTNDAVFQSERFGNFSYSIPVPQNGAYNVDLLFAELYHGVNNTKGVGARVFNLNVEDQFTAQNVDIIQQAGAPATALILQASNVQVSDGFLNITFTTVVDNAKISGIAVFHADEINQPLSFQAPPDTTLTEGQYWDYQLLAGVLPGNESPKYASKGLPASLRLDPETGLISGTIEASAGKFPVTLRALDRSGAVRESFFLLTVSEVNAPVVNANVLPSYCRGTALSIQIEGVDPNGDALIYQLAGESSPLPPGLTLNAKTGLISGVIDANDENAYELAVRATDPSGASGLTRFTLRTDYCGNFGASDEDEAAVIFPNPASRELFLRVRVEQKGRYSFGMVNAIGLTTSLGAYALPEGVHTIRFDLEPMRLPSGLYYFSIGGGNLRKKIKVILER